MTSPIGRLTPHRRRLPRWAKALSSCVLLVSWLLASGCSWFNEPINSSPGMRWWLFSNFGAQRVCPEMLKRGAALRLSPGGNVVGRFFPSQCQHQVNDAARTVTLRFSGTGFAWTPVAGRIGFSAEAAVEYKMDFFLGDEEMYIWARPQRTLSGPEFQIGSVENKVVDWATRSPVGYLANNFGTQILSSQLAQGFTVVRTDEGDEFALGHLRPPQRPPKPFDLSGSDRFALANETTEVRPEQVDVLGPFEVADDGQALFLQFRVQGPAVEAFLVHRGTADLWRDGLQRGAALGPPPGNPLRSWALQAGREGRHKLSLPRGQYVIILDNSSRLGTVTPQWNPLGMLGGTATVVSYTAALGDEDDAF